MNSNLSSTEKSQNFEELGVILLNSDGSISQVFIYLILIINSFCL
jgi:hypothetical protein